MVDNYGVTDETRHGTMGSCVNDIALVYFSFDILGTVELNCLQCLASVTGFRCKISPLKFSVTNRTVKNNGVARAWQIGQSPSLDC